MVRCKRIKVSIWEVIGTAAGGHANKVTKVVKEIRLSFIFRGRASIVLARSLSLPIISALHNTRNLQLHTSVFVTTELQACDAADACANGGFAV